MTTTQNRQVIAKWLMLLVAIVTVVMFISSKYIFQVLPMNSILMACNRILTIGFAATTGLTGLILLCAVVGFLVLIDRRRRGKVRQASA